MVLVINLITDLMVLNSINNIDNTDNNDNNTIVFFIKETLYPFFPFYN